MTLARMRRRGRAVFLAGLLLLLGAPVYQGLVLAPAGFPAPGPATPAGFGPYLLWSAAHPWQDAGSRVVEALPFLLALGLPAALVRIVWPGAAGEGRAAARLGLAGFALFAAALLVGLAAVPVSAGAYAAHPAQRAAIAGGYANLYAAQSLLARLVADGCLAASLALICLRGAASTRLPGWFAYLGLAAAGLLGITALLALLGMAQPATQAERFALPILAIWLLAAGALLLRVQARPREAAAPAPAEPAQPAAASEGGERPG
jgi:hypothetical protein